MMASPITPPHSATGRLLVISIEVLVTQRVRGFPVHTGCTGERDVLADNALGDLQRIVKTSARAWAAWLNSQIRIAGPGSNTDWLVRIHPPLQPQMRPWRHRSEPLSAVLLASG